jgi:hypothetical protein
MAPGRWLLPVGVEQDRPDDKADNPERATMHPDAGRAASSLTGFPAVIDPG